MSRRWDSHWKKTGKQGPSPFAATPSHREQWAAQLTKLKQKAAYRRSQQQAQQAQHAQQAQDAQQAQQAKQAQEPCPQKPSHQPHQHDVQSSATAQGSGNLEQNAEHVLSQEQQQHPVELKASINRSSNELHEASVTRRRQTLHAKLTHSAAVTAAEWHTQYNSPVHARSAESQAAPQHHSAHTARREDVGHGVATMSVPMVSQIKLVLDTKAQEYIASLEERAKIISQQCEDLANGTSDHQDDVLNACAASEENADSVHSSTSTPSHFQTPQSRVQSQLAGLRRRAARKQTL